MNTKQSKPTNSTKKLFPADLEARLRREGKRPPQPNPRNPLLLAKLIRDDGGELYAMELHEDSMVGGTMLTCFDSTFEEGFPIIFLPWLEERARLCPDFSPARLSEFDRRWFNLPRSEDQW